MADSIEPDEESDFASGWTSADEGVTDWASPSTGGGSAPALPALPAVGRGARFFLDRLSEAEGTDEPKAHAHGYASGYDMLYDTVKPARGQKPLSQMTLDEVAALQARTNRLPVGRYQFKPDTLRELRDHFQLSGSELLSPELQDQFGRRLMTKRGYDNPAFSPHEVQSQFSREWAALPDLTGYSHYQQTVSHHQQPVGMSSQAFQDYLARARAMDAGR